MILAMDTSTSLASLSLYDGQVVAETSWLAGRHHTRQVMPEVEHALSMVGRHVEAISAVAVARGPGSFTGVRAGIALARGLAAGRQVPLYGVCSLDVLAMAVPCAHLPVRVLLDAGRGRFATSLYRWENGRPKRIEKITGTDLEGLRQLVMEPTVLVGDLRPEARDRIRQELAGLAVLPGPAVSLRRAGLLAELAWDRFTAGERPGPEDSEPIYI